MRYGWLSVVLWSLLFFSSCSKDVPSPYGSSASSGQAPTGDIIADINGSIWAAPDGYFRRSASSITIYGQREKGNTINLTINPYTGPKTYEINGITKIIYYEDNVQYTCVNGQITVSGENDYFIEGTFSGEVIEGGALRMQILGGQFYIEKE